MTLDDTAIAELQHRIEALPAQPRTKPADVIAQLLPAIDAARARGLSVEAIQPLLREAGVTLATKTVRDYLSRARRASTNQLPRAAQHRPLPVQDSPAQLQRPQGSREEGSSPPAASNKPLPGRFQLVPDTEKL